MQISPGAHESGVHVREHVMLSWQRPLGQRRGAGRSHVPSSRHSPGSVIEAPLHVGLPHEPPTGVGMHVPSCSRRSHESHSSSHAVSQQRPSEQWLLTQSVFAPQRAPSSARGTQECEELLQVRSGPQLPTAHSDAQRDEPSHRPCGHARGSLSTQLPPASQRPPSSSIAEPGPPLHTAVPHMMPTVRGDHAVFDISGLHDWQTLLGLIVNAPKHAPSM